MGRVGRCVFTITVFGMRFFLCKSGVNEEKIKKDSKVAHCWEGGWTSVRDERKGEKGEPMDRQTARMLRVLSGVARGSHSGSTQGQARMAAPGGAGLAIAVPQGQYSHAGAIAILTRELPSEDVQKLDGIHQGIINLITPMQAMPWKTLVRGLLKLSEKFMPVNYLLPTAASERCLKDHLKACLHDCVPPAIRFDVDWENDIGWDDVRDYALSAHSDMNAAKAGLAVKPVPGTAGLMTVGGAVQPGGGTPGPTGTHVPGGPGPHGGQGAPGAVADEYVYTGKIPANQVQFNTDFGYVQKCFIDEMKQQQWSGVVRVDGEFYSVRPKDATPPSLLSGANEQDPTRKNTVTQSFTKLGMRKSDTFGAGYERMGVEVASQISNTHDSIEQYVKLNFAHLDQGGAGQKAQLRELVRSAQTVDIMVQRVAGRGGSQKDLEEDDVFEMQLCDDAVHETPASALPVDDASPSTACASSGSTRARTSNDADDDDGPKAWCSS